MQFPLTSYVYQICVSFNRMLKSNKAPGDGETSVVINKWGFSFKAAFNILKSWERK